MPLVNPFTLSAEQSNRISEAKTFQELGLLRQEMLDRRFLQNKQNGGELSSLAIVANMIHERIIRQSVQLSINQLELMGMGKPPVPYAFLQFGSGGREEQGLISDQDNGLIYQVAPELAPEEVQQIESYFRLLAAAVVQGLEEAGYPPCQGNVICSNRRWHGSIETWTAMIDQWVEQPVWENIRYLLLVSDVRLLAGDSALLQRFQEHLFAKLAATPAIIPRLVSNTLYHRVPLGLFGRILTEVNGRYRGAINLKYGVYLPLVNCVRMFSLANGIEANSTLNRLAALRSKQIWPSQFCQQVSDHFHYLLGLRLITPLDWEDDNYADNSYLKLDSVPKEVRSHLKDAMKLALELQSMTAKLAKTKRSLTG
ncbi:DUF294 nucleotidyltransferase-like domain-containing protein [Brevibacillus fulvus]|uniref:CBS domain-containing protein n=1 Tax=Brevibacillus fulvus TaxID=1125967 RepID=A0A939BRL4_9BACL|nr:DUF294 nucleotidyltransferase-like domain-containing protein [Brevibacillus fulvus]MBM7589757.1 CBS domain-containing protein [Brevibacillus fulvus]